MKRNYVHEDYMKKLLYTIFTHEVGSFLGFKGGTLAYLCHGLDRFSTDIDIDLLDITKEQIVIDTMREILVVHGDIKNEVLGKNLHRRVFRYDERSMNIKIELNKRFSHHNTYHIQSIDNLKLQCMTTDCMFTNKLVALYNRWYPRDLYDVHFFCKNKFTLKESLVYERVNMNTVELIESIIDMIPKYFAPHQVLHGLGEVLDEKQKIRVKTRLVDETIQFLQFYLDAISLQQKNE